MPKVSVLMPVYNASRFLNLAVDSIFSQSYQDFELLAIDDCSTDNSMEILRSYTDRRITVLKNDTNLGVAKTLNRGLDLVQSEYVARMDADDICVSDRLKKQIEYMEKNQALGLVGSWVRFFNREKSYILRYPLGIECLKAFVLFDNPVCHPTVMLRKKMFDDHGLRYDEHCIAAQDYELWSRCVLKFPIENIPIPLVQWRANDKGVTQTRFDKSNLQALRIQEKELAKLGMEATAEELKKHREIGNGSGFASHLELQNALDWLDSLVRKNRENGIYPQEGMLRAAAFAWFRTCMNSSGLGIRVLKMYWHSRYRAYYRPGIREFFIMVLNALFRFRKESVGKPGSY